MQDPDFISIFVAPLEKVGLRYMVTGSVASSIYGEPRNTLDIDLVLLLEKSQGKILTGLFPEEEFYIPPVEVIEIEARREARGHFNIIHHETGFKADIYLSRNHPYLDWAFGHTRRIESPACQANIAPPEYVILHKLEFYKESNHQRHLRDIAGILEQQELDHDFLTAALSRLNLNTEYQLALSLADLPS